MAFDDKTEIHGQLLQEFPCLEIVSGPHAGARFPLQMGKNQLGRAEENEIVLDDSSVSRKHAAVERTPNTLTLADVGSRNGTKVGGERITQPVPLEHEGRFKIGLYEFRLLMSDAPPASPSVTVENKKEPSSPKIETPSYSSRKVDAGKPDSGRPESGKPDSGTSQKIEDPQLSSPSPDWPSSGGLPELEGEGDFVEEPGSSSGTKRRRWILLGGLVMVLLVAGYFGKGPVLKMVAKYQNKGHKRGALQAKLERERARKAREAQVKETLEEPTQEVTEGPIAEGEVPPPTAVVPPEDTSPASAPAPLSEDRPVFLDFSSSPLPAEIYFGDQTIGTTPLRSNTNLKVGRTYEARGVFQLPDLAETIEDKIQFTFAEGANVVPVHFAGKVGVFKVGALPRDAQLYLEGYFEKDPYRSKPIKFAEIVYGKPIYVPFGRYIVEMRRNRQLANSQTFLDEVVYRREFFIKEDQSNYTVEVRDEDLSQFPIKIDSKPTTARVFIDDQEVGVTPYTGTFPVGEHILTLKRDGYFDYSQLVKVALNTPYTTEIQLKTTEAGELVNRAVDLMKEERHAEALPILVEAFAKNPSARETAQISYFVGLCYLKQKMYAEANSYFTKAAEHPDFVATAKLGLASLAAEQGDPKRGLSLLVEVLLVATDPKVRADAGLLFQKISPLRSVVYVTSDPVGANVWVNGVDIKQVTPLILHDLSLGNYRVEARKEGYQNTESKLNLGVSEFQPLVIKLTPVVK